MIKESAISAYSRRLDCQIELFRESSNSRVFSAERGRVHSKDYVAGLGYAVRTIKGSQMGFYSFEREAEFGSAVGKAIRLGKFQEKAGYFFPALRGASKRYFDKRSEDFGNFAMHELEGMLNAQEEMGVLSVQNIFGASTTSKVLMNSEGGNTESKSSLFFAISQCGFRDTEADDSISCAKFNFSPSKAAANAAKFARASAGAKKIREGKTEVIFDIRALHQLLPLFMPFNFSGESVRKNLTKLRIGEMFAGRNISITSDPSMAGGVRPAEFDDEGFACKKTRLVENGRVGSFLFDMQTSAKIIGEMGTKPGGRIGKSGGKKEGIQINPKPGNASRGSFNSPPGISFSDIALEGGDANDLVSECTKGIYINSFLTSGANPVTGDFAFPLLVAFKIENGQPVHAIEGAMIKGNFFALMRRAKFERETETYNGLDSGRMACELEIIV